MMICTKIRLEAAGNVKTKLINRFIFASYFLALIGSFASDICREVMSSHWLMIRSDLEFVIPAGYFVGRR